MDTTFFSLDCLPTAMEDFTETSEDDDDDEGEKGLLIASNSS